jgi:hypothetical protein
MAHLEGAPFQSGVDAGKWGLPGATTDIVWPHPVIWVVADLKIVPQGKVFLRFAVDNYPSLAPTACPWDIKINTKLADNLYPRLDFVRQFSHLLLKFLPPELDYRVRFLETVIRGLNKVRGGGMPGFARHPRRPQPRSNH